MIRDPLAPRGDTAGQAACPPPELIQALAAGTLPPRLESRVTAHVAQCRLCRELGAALDDPSVGAATPEELDRILQHVCAEVGVPTLAPRRRVWRWTAAAAAVILVAAGAWLAWQSRRLPAGSVFDLDKPDLVALDSPGRPGEPAMEPRERAELTQALAPFRNDDYSEAARLLAAFVARYPRSVAGYFYQGVTDLFLDRDASAVVALEAAEGLIGRPVTPLERQASWYLALAYRRTGHDWGALSRMEVLCNGGDDIARRACIGLQELSVTYRLTGTVTTDAGEPLQGATIAEYVIRADSNDLVINRTSVSGTSDDAGRFAMSGLGNPLPWLIRASKPGYFTVPLPPPVSAEMVAAFRLTPWTWVALEDVVKGTLEPDVTICGGHPCRQFAVSLPRSGTLEVSLVTPVREALDLWVETPSGDIHAPQIGAPLRLAVPAVAGGVYQITVRTFRIRTEPRPFELTMQVK
jgi:hypothetical protein